MTPWHFYGYRPQADWKVYWKACNGFYWKEEQPYFIPVFAPPNWQIQEEASLNDFTVHKILIPIYRKVKYIQYFMYERNVKTKEVRQVKYDYPREIIKL